MWGDPAMTIELCLAHAAGYKYAGVEYGTECWYGDGLSGGYLEAGPDNCNFPCPGAPNSEYCGAGDRIVLYATTGNAAVIGSYAFQGCYHEPTDGHRALPYLWTDPAMTPELCLAQAVGYKYAGVEYGIECWYGPSLWPGSGGVEPTPDGCNMPCPGNSLSFCGAGDRLTLYALPGGGGGGSPTQPATVTAGTSSWNFVECRTEATDSRALTGAAHAGDDMTLEVCAGLCAGWAFFGTEYGRECYCGDAFQAGSVPAPQADCSFPCAANALELCGAANRLSVYVVA